ncbi:adenosine kinase [Sessilibacter corallicola]|uniref:adenosine kinase n=1 Tax=Sessilibacter corallicola TaxID=2904075 RepID=UPI001E35C407|nr:adenosine kinase [Sessilibacter corallicola]
MSEYDIYGIGNALVDTEIEVTDSDLEAFGIEKGFMTLVDESRQFELMELLKSHLVASRRASGGSACNTIIAASYFGAKTFYSCKLANDENGKFYLNDLERAGVDYLPEFANHEGTSGKCLVMITPDAERTMNTYLGISEKIGEEQLYLPAIGKSQYIYIEGYLSSSDTARAAVAKLREQAKNSNVKTALTFSDPAMVNYFREPLTEMIGDGVDLLFCNEEEALSFTDTSELSDAIEAIKAFTKTFAITRGAEGAIVFDGETLSEIAPNKANPIDTNGAGDLFAGAFLYAISQGHSFVEAGNLASLASATLVEQFGPRLRPEQYADIRSKVLGH